MKEKKLIAGIVLLFSAAFWVLSVRVFSEETYVLAGVISFLVAVFLSLLMFRGDKCTAERKWGILFLPAAVSLLIIPYPYSVGFFLCAAGFLFLALLPERNFWRGLLTSGLIFTLQAGGMALYLLFIPSSHSAYTLSYVVYPLLRLFGVTASFQGGVAYLQEGGDVFPFPLTWDTLGIYPFILLVLPLLIFLLLDSKTSTQAVNRGVGLCGVSLVYLVFRYITLLHIYFSSDVGITALSRFKEIFFSPLSLIVTFAPFIFIVICIYAVHIAVEFPHFTLEKRRVLSSCAIIVGAFLLTGAVMYTGGGTPKGGRVLVDEIHSAWEPSTLILDTKWYGSESTYNAYSMVEWLKVTYDVDRVVSPAYTSWNPGEDISKVEPDLVSETITADILKTYDILILKTPTMYSPEEIDAIVSFVQGGGGLLVIGDHSNYAGTSTSLNAITKYFGVEFQFDSVNTAAGLLSVYERGKIAHPCAKYMPSFDFLTSCSIRAPLNAGRVIPGYGLDAEPGEYASTGFFRETRRDLPILATDRNWGIFHQAVAVHYGKGRVVAFADSTTISNFRIFFGGSANLIAGCMEWLNYENTFPYLRTLFFAGGIALLGVGVVLGRWETTTAFFIVALLLLGVGGSLSVYTFSPDLYNTVPTRSYAWEDTVCFDASHSPPIVNSGRAEGEHSTFVIWTQRVGRVPTIEDSLEACVEKGKTVVIIDPVRRTFSPEEVELLKAHVERGGNVLLMIDSSRVYGLNLMAAFGLDVTDIAKPPDDTSTGPFLPWGVSVEGGEALKTAGERVILCRVAYGSGYFVVCTASSAFKDGTGGQPGYMGYNGTDPKELGEEMKAVVMELYYLEFELFGDILK